MPPARWSYPFRRLWLRLSLSIKPFMFPCVLFGVRVSAQVFLAGVVDDIRVAWRCLDRLPDHRYSNRLPLMRRFRLSLYFAIGLLFSTWVVFAYAETMAPYQVWTQNGFTCATGTGQCLTTPELAAGAYCSSLGKTVTTVTDFRPGQSRYYYQCSNSGGYNSYTIQGCDGSQNWTLSGGVCTRSDCTADQVRGAGGICECPSGKELDGGTCKTACPSGYHRLTPDVPGQCAKDCIGNQVQSPDGACRCTPTSNGIYSVQKQNVGSSGCDGGCVVANLAGAPFVCTAFTTTCYAYGGRNGMVCTPATPPRVDITLAPLPPPAPVPPPVAPTPENPTPPPPDPKTTPDNNKDPVACGSSGGTYLTVNGQGKCATAGPDNGMETVKAKVNDTVTTNPDGTKTITTEKTIESVDPKTGQTTTSKTTTTTTKDASGNTTGTGTSESTGQSPTGTGSGSGAGSGDSGDGKGQCAKEPNSPMCKIGTVSEKGMFSDTQSGKVDAAKAALRAKFAEVKLAAQAMFAGNLGTGSGSLPCYPSINVLGRSWSMCFTQFEGDLALIGAFIMLSAALGAAFIVLRR